MEYDLHQNKVTGIRLAYIGGGSRGWAWKFMTDLAMEPALGGEVALYDIDRAAAQANEIIGNRIDHMPGVQGRWRYSVADTLEQALTGADFVVISILPGTFDEMAVDVHMPERLNIWQSVGDTTGPGGIIRALRTLPMLAPIAQGVRDICPNAWVINYTNPMAMCVETLYNEFPQIKAFGCCHEVFGTQKLLAMAVGEALGIPTPDRREIRINVLGINHFTWIDKASYKGLDLFPVYRDFVDKYYESGFNEPGKNWANSSFECAHRVKFDLFRRFGLIAAAGDRHLAEFMPGDEYLKDPETVKRWKFGLTSVQWRKDDLKERLAKSRAMASGEREVDMEPTGEEGVLLIKALCGLGRVVSNVNMPTVGMGSWVAETNAVFDRDSVQPVAVGEVPDEIWDLIRPHLGTYYRTQVAVSECDREWVVKALMWDPNTSAKCTDKTQIRALVDDMIAGTAKYLPEGWMK